MRGSPFTQPDHPRRTLPTHLRYTSRWMCPTRTIGPPSGVGSCSPALHCRRATRFPASTSSCGPLLNAFGVHIVAVMLEQMASSARHAPIPRERRQPDPTYTRCVPTARAEADRMAGKREAQMQLRVWEAYQGARRRSSSALSVHVADAMPCI
ncbi:hypothetical protein B0H14DRAFT_2989466 [Mycena olivaceomarginata]|nr:hypothetical protein B0H14DRAFT_2989466 [Mycena olivaceomarginata]